MAPRPAKRAPGTTTKTAKGRARTNRKSSGEESDSLESRIVKLATTGKLRAAANNAVKVQRAAGLAVVYQKGTRIIREHPDGRKETVRTVDAFRAVPDRFRSLVVRKPR